MTSPGEAAHVAAALTCCRPRCQCTRRTAAGWRVHCPAHDDRSPSLTVTESDGRALVHCQAGCAQRTVIAALRERGLWSQRSRKNHKLAITYPYRDETGKLLFEVLRYEPKSFKQRRPAGNGRWVWNLDGVRRVPYRLPELLQASPEAWVFVTEGEKDADRLASLGLVAITNPSGAGNWQPEISPHLKGRRVAILTDNDEAGEKRVEDVAQKLLAHAAEIKIVRLPGLLLKGDVSDYLDEHTTEELLSLVETTPFWEPTRVEDLAALLADVEQFIARYVVVGEAERTALALWVAHTHAFEAAECSPYLHITSAEKESGKTRLLEVLNVLVGRPWFTSRVSAAVLVRKVAKDTPTLLLDETDSAFKGEAEYAEALRGILNAGYRRGGVASLCVKKGGDYDLVDFPVFCPKALAGIGGLPDTIADRSIRINMKRRSAAESVARFRLREALAQAKPLRERLERWASVATGKLASARPLLPDELSDRAADVWEPLLAIADMAGGDWPGRSREAALALAGHGAEDGLSLGSRLLRDIARILGNRKGPVSSSAVVAALVELEEAPWGDLRGKPLDPRGLARLLRPYGIRPRLLRVGGNVSRGYHVEDFLDAFSRYCICTPEISVTDAEAEYVPGAIGVTPVTHVTLPRDVQEPVGARSALDEGQGGLWQEVVS